MKEQIIVTGLKNTRRSEKYYLTVFMFSVLIVITCFVKLVTGFEKERLSNTEKEEIVVDTIK